LETGGIAARFCFTSRAIMPNDVRHRRSPAGVRASRTDLAILIAGLVASASSGVVAYRIVGPYGDGPINVGLYRTQDPETGEQFVYREVRKDDGTLMRYLFDDDSRRLKQIQVIRIVDGKPVVVGLHVSDGGLTRLDAGGETMEREQAGGVKRGFSFRGNGVIDAWEYRDAKGQLVKIEVSRHQDGHVDRWEYYQEDQLARVEEDENRDGRVDHWLNYEVGILVKEAWDRDGDGKPDPGR
jgi:hypothetical protein